MVAKAKAVLVCYRVWTNDPSDRDVYNKPVELFRGSDGNEYPVLYYVQRTKGKDSESPMPMMRLPRDAQRIEDSAACVLWQQERSNHANLSPLS